MQGEEGATDCTGRIINPFGSCPSDSCGSHQQYRRFSVSFSVYAHACALERMVLLKLNLRHQLFNETAQMALWYSRGVDFHAEKFSQDPAAELAMSSVATHGVVQTGLGPSFSPIQSEPI